MNATAPIPANFLILDAARLGVEIETAKALNPDHLCLYDGQQAVYYGDVAPWVFTFGPEAPAEFLTWILLHSGGQSWGIFLEFPGDISALRDHLKKFETVELGDDDASFFRYYDPRVLHRVMPIMTPEQLHGFFGPVRAIFAEDQTGQIFEFRNLGSELSVTSTIRLPIPKS
jgi:hypothetical protein